jgi:hypothetical protein
VNFSYSADSVDVPRVKRQQFQRPKSAKPKLKKSWKNAGSKTSSTKLTVKSKQ